MTGESLSKVSSAQQHGPPAPEAAAIESRLAGHLGHLTAQEQTAFEEFKKICTDKGYYTPATADKKASHDDGTLIRYLRARKFVPQEAFLQFSDTEEWRKDNDLDALYEKIDINDYWESRSVYPQWTGRRDKRGVPVYLYEVHKLDSKKMVAYSSSTSKHKQNGTAPSRMLRLFALYENLTRFVMPLCSAVPGRPNPESPVDQSNNIVDISKVGLKQFWNLKNHMQDASTLATAHYPETLDRIFILGAPAFFPTVWGWIKKWFDPITTSKIFILSHHQVLPTLTQFIDIENIPKKYGGKLDFECGKMPVLDPQVRACLTLAPGPDTERFFLTAPVHWVDENDEGEMTALGVGTLDGKQRRDPVATLHSTVVRMATHQSQRALLEADPLSSRPPTSQGQTTPAISAKAALAATTAASTISEPVSQTSAAPSLSNEPPSMKSPALQTDPASIQVTPHSDLANMTILDQPKETIANGKPPDNITLPVTSLPIERTKTEFVTPPNDPEVNRQLAVSQ